MSYDLDRFVEFQKRYYTEAFNEIRKGKKENHWMWFIFPQIIGLGRTATSLKFSIKDIYEAKSYLENEYLRENLFIICNELLKLNINDSIQIFGYLDSMKLKSSMTLFDYTVRYFEMKIDNVFVKVLKKFYDGEKDNLTIDIITHMNQNKSLHIM